MGQVYEEFGMGQEVTLKSSHRSFKDVTLIVHTEDDIEIEPFVKCLSVTKDGSVSEIEIHKSLLEAKVNYKGSLPIG